MAHTSDADPFLCSRGAPRPAKVQHKRELNVEMHLSIIDRCQLLVGWHDAVPGRDTSANANDTGTCPEGLDRIHLYVARSIVHGYYTEHVPIATSLRRHTKPTPP